MKFEWFGGKGWNLEIWKYRQSGKNCMRVWEGGSCCFGFQAIFLSKIYNLEYWEYFLEWHNGILKMFYLEMKETFIKKKLLLYF